MDFITEPIFSHPQKSPDDDYDLRQMQNVTTGSMLHTTGGHHQTTLHQKDFALNALPPMKSQAERTLRLLLDDCVGEKEQVEAGRCKFLPRSRIFS